MQILAARKYCSSRISHGVSTFVVSRNSFKVEFHSFNPPETPLSIQPSIVALCDSGWRAFKLLSISCVGLGSQIQIRIG